MNIDVVNGKVARELKMDERMVKKVNEFYWNNIKAHLKRYDPSPISVEGVCVIYPSGKWNRNELDWCIKELRRLKGKERIRKEDTLLEYYKGVFRQLWKLRKHYKYVY
jgi:hypothetical protein